MKKDYVFLSFSLGHSSVSDHFSELSQKLLTNYNVIIFSDKPKPDDLIISNEINIKYWPSKRPTKFKDAYFLYKEIKKYSPVLTISLFGSVNLFILVSFLCGVKHRVAWIRTLSTQFPQKRINIFRKSLVYKLATNIITNSNATKEDTIQVFKVKDSKITVLPNSVKNYNDLLGNIPIDKSKIVYVGRLHYSKGIDILIRAFSELINQNFDVHLDIIGNGSEKDNLLELTSKLNLSERVHFLGGKTKVEVLQAFKSCYCSVVSSRSEAFGFTVIEAMSVGTCVIGANNTGIKEIIIDNETGLLFETDNYLDLALKIKSILVDEGFRNKYALEGFKHFMNNFENTYAINRDLTFFQTLIKDEK